MKTRYRLKRFILTFLGVTVLLIVGASKGFCEQVTVKEAIAVADLWYAMEINSDHVKLEPEEKAARIGQIRNRSLLYLVAKDEVSRRPPEEGKGPILAYIVQYRPTGFVVVSGEDRIEPILVFNAENDFRYDEWEHNYMPFYLEKALGGRWDILNDEIAAGKQPPTHERWIRLRSRLNSKPDLKTITHRSSGGGDGIYVLWDTPLWDQGDPYDETVIAHNGGIAGIPTGCVATAMAIKMRYHEWPLTGEGAHFYFDLQGSVNFVHYVDFGAQSYDWSAMPTKDIDPAQSYPELADLMYHCGVSVDMDYEVGSSGAYTGDAPAAMRDYFRYTGYLWHTSNHEPDLITSIRGGLPTLLRWDGHAMVADGYRDTGPEYFHINLGWSGGSNDWYNLNNVLGHVIIGSAPFSQPEGWKYVSWKGSTYKWGTLPQPYQFLSEANAAVPAGGQIWIESGTYTGSGNEPITFSKAMKIKPYLGPVIIK